MNELIARTVLANHLVDERLQSYRSNNQTHAFISDALTYGWIGYQTYSLAELLIEYHTWHGHDNPLEIKERAHLEASSVGDPSSVYYQPDIDYIISNELPSWLVWRSATQCRVDNPGATINTFQGNDIEQHTYAD